MRKVMVVLCVLNTMLGITQVNLVPNPSFEDTTSCPSLGGLDGLDHWSYCGGTADYYNSCANSTTPQYGVPANWIGFQTARSGNGYIGLATWAHMSVPNREYIGIQLSQPLVVGTTYFVTAFIVKADSGDVPPFTCASNNFNFKFSTVQYDYSNPAPTNNDAQIGCNTIVSDTTNWFRVNGSFIADSAYEFLMLGNFYDDANTDTVLCNYNLAYAYYYVDDICVSADSATCDIGQNIGSYSNAAQFLFYPNPAVSYLFVGNIAQGVNLPCQLYEVTGRLVLSKTLNAVNNSIDISSVDRGVYYLIAQEQTHIIVITK